MAVVTLLLATTTVLGRSSTPTSTPELSGDGPQAPVDLVTRDDPMAIPATPEPAPEESRSEAVVRALDNRRGSDPTDARDFPTLATYVYSVDGWEEGTALGRRDYPSEMRMRVHRPPMGPNGPLADDELLFDLDFSPEHRQRAVVSYDDEVSVTYEDAEIDFGPVERTTEASYQPPLLQILAPLLPHESVSGTSEARNRDGELVRTDDWSVEVVGQESVEALGRDIDTWVVRVERTSRPGTDEQLDSTRTYWFDTDRRIFVRWTEELQGSQPLGPGNFIYETRYTATLERLEPLPS